ncbi:MAG: outer membrane lipoprotein carrier protein LolA [Holosporaceae bacterium]|jgi:outer membrane lipoprotein-sorting protein|nr:outer membrane lipoprotein carrier protein LolA [Holosporaceae bacterium]
MMRKIFIVAISFFFGLKPICANQQDHVAEVEKYLNDITTFESDFIQVDRRGRVSYGRFFLKRPFLMKMDYWDPPTNVIIARNNQIIHYDRELKEKTVTSMYSSPLSFFLEKKIDLQKNLRVLSVRDESDMLSIKFCRKDESAEGAVILVFSKDPMTLRKWIIFPSKSKGSLSDYTEISLMNWKSGHVIPDEEFNRFACPK